MAKGEIKTPYHADKNNLTYFNCNSSPQLSISSDIFRIIYLSGRLWPCDLIVYIIKSVRVIESEFLNHGSDY